MQLNFAGDLGKPGREFLAGFGVKPRRGADVIEKPAQFARIVQLVRNRRHVALNPRDLAQTELVHRLGLKPQSGMLRDLQPV